MAVGMPAFSTVVRTSPPRYIQLLDVRDNNLEYPDDASRHIFSRCALESELTCYGIPPHSCTAYPDYVPSLSNDQVSAASEPEPSEPILWR